MVKRSARRANDESVEKLGEQLGEFLRERLMDNQQEEESTQAASREPTGRGIWRGLEAGRVFARESLYAYIGFLSSVFRFRRRGR